jgi:hypothetical protein
MSENYSWKFDAQVGKERYVNFRHFPFIPQRGMHIILPGCHVSVGCCSYWVDKEEWLVEVLNGDVRTLMRGGFVLTER